ncbi:MAG: hypothetical protein LH472_07595 [Pyrinomonadaceae bacterium]|nr:hypothetical protein [Pyrinomonadaceae bacterium]
MNLAAKGREILSAVNAAFTTENGKRKDSSFLTLGYAEFLAEAGEAQKAESVLNRAVANSRNQEFLEAARNFYQTEDDKSGEQIALQRLAETTISPRRSIRFRLQLAEVSRKLNSAKRRKSCWQIWSNSFRQISAC